MRWVGFSVSQPIYSIHDTMPRLHVNTKYCYVQNPVSDVKRAAFLTLAKLPVCHAQKHQRVGCLGMNYSLVLSYPLMNPPSPPLVHVSKRFALRNKTLQVNMVMSTMLASVAEGMCLSDSLGLSNDALIEVCVCACVCMYTKWRQYSSSRAQNYRSGGCFMAQGSKLKQKSRRPMT